MEDRRNELYHYGVRGMKWGVRKMVRSTKRDLKTVKKLEKQNTKNVAELKKLDKKVVEKQNRKPTEKDWTKHEKMIQKQYSIRLKSSDIINSNRWKYFSEQKNSNIDTNSSTFKRGKRYTEKMSEIGYRIFTNTYEEI